jgi:hypothetical protein
MKKSISRLILSPQFQSSFWSAILRRFVLATDAVYNYSAAFKLDMQAVERPHYAYCMLKAADLARRLGHQKISAIEFGVAGGNGLAFMCSFAKEVATATKVETTCYGFDTGQGMPSPEGVHDLPYWFAPKQYPMDKDALLNKLPEAHLVIGNIKDIIGDFLSEYNPRPIGVIFNDTDYWSSTRESFRLFDQAAARPQNFLPRLFMYFDDIIGSDIEMYGPCNGQLLAIDEYNARQDAVKIHLNRNLLKHNHIPYRWQIYYAHLFLHPDYCKFIGAERQAKIEEALKLR